MGIHRRNGLFCGAHVPDCPWQNERNSIQCGIVVDKGYTAAYSSYRYDADTGRSSSTSHGPQYRICIEGEKNGAIVQYWFSATEEEYARSRIGEFFAR